MTNGIIVEKFEGNENDDWLDVLKTYILEKFGGENFIVDIRKTISIDFNFDRIVSNTRTSMIR